MYEATQLERSRGRAPRRAGSRSSGDGQSAQRLAKGLGWFSLGLGLAQLASPRGMTSLVTGRAPRGPGRMRALGLREIAAGIGILSRPQPAPWVWARVAGDLLDLALLGSTLGMRRTSKGRVLGSMAMVAGVTALDAVAAVRLSGSPAQRRDLVASVVIGRSPDEVYRFYRDFRNAPRFMAGVESVVLDDDRRSHWRARLPGGSTVEWDAEITSDLTGEALAWRTLPGAPLPHDGTVTFRAAPAGRGTVVRVEMSYQASGLIRKVAGGMAHLQMTSDLRRLKQLLEVGEVLLSDANVELGPHPARPAGRRLVEPGTNGGVR
jgi:uncharacterized membrane protein